MDDTFDSMFDEDGIVSITDEKLLARLLAMANEIMDITDKCAEEQSNSEYCWGKYLGYMGALLDLRRNFVMDERFPDYIEGFTERNTRKLRQVNCEGKQVEQLEDSETEWSLSKAAADIFESLEDEEAVYKGGDDENARGMAAAYRETLKIIFKHFGEMESIRALFAQMPQLPSE